MTLLAITLGLFNALAPMQTAKDEFVFNNNGEIESLDPAFLSGVPDATIAVQVFEGLLSRNADWQTIVPGLAEKMPGITDGGKIYTFKLRKNLKWSDGTPLTAKDFEYSWLRALDPKTMASYAYWFADNIVGAAEYNKNPTLENAKKVEARAIDDLTFVVKLKKPLSSFTQICAEALSYPVQKEAIEKWKDQWTKPEHFVGNGPFRLVEWKVQDKMVLEKNPNYYDADKVALKRVIAYPIADRQTAVNLFKQGKLDWSGTNGAPNALVPSFKSDPNFRIHPAYVSYLYWLNTKNPPLNDKRVRQALVLAVDRKQLVERVTRGFEIPASFFVPQNIGSYHSPSGIVSPNYAADVERARKLLADAGFPGGKGFRQLKLQYNTDENHKKVALAVQQMWKKALGIDVEPTNTEFKVYLAEQTAMHFDLSRGGWQGDYTSPGTFLELLTSSSGNNHTGWKNSKYDELFEKASTTLNEKDQNKLYNEAETLMLDEAPIIPLYIYTNFSFIRPEVVGFQENLIDRPFLRYVSKK
jgi:oligopeptide transport system substrate-binding protein